MKKGLLLIITCLLGLSMVTGCSLESLNPLADKSKPAKENNQKVAKIKQGSNKEKQEVDIDDVVVKMVDEIRAGFFERATSLGEGVYEQGQESVKFLDTIAVAYGYKFELEGLNDKEKEKYIKTLRKLVQKDPTNRFRKSVLAIVLVETGNLKEGLKIAEAAYNAGEEKPKAIMDTYGWALYRSGNIEQALPIFTTLNQIGLENLSQTYHTAVVIENANKATALSIYKNIVGWANNAVTWEENKDNLAATAHINKIKKDAQNAINRIQLRGRS